MRRAHKLLITYVVISFLVTFVTRALAQSDSAGWTIPEGASKAANPLSVTPELVDRGKELFADNCERCHGPKGRGDGSDADPDDPPADLTDQRRAARNRDGVVFHKIWNGRTDPEMPAFKDEGLSEEDVWTIVAYVQTLRRK
ncbi:MAG: cytochrome c [Vicinamibacteraceae bacterium]